MNLTATDICKIIKACKDTDVAELKFLDLHIVFSSTKEIVESNPPVVEMTGEQAQSVHQQEIFETDEKSAKEDSLSLMLIENPLEHERLLASGELEDEAV